MKDKEPLDADDFERMGRLIYMVGVLRGLVQRITKEVITNPSILNELEIIDRMIKEEFYDKPGDKK